jgi:hypothetical protein
MKEIRNASNFNLSLIARQFLQSFLQFKEKKKKRKEKEKKIKSSALFTRISPFSLRELYVKLQFNVPLVSERDSKCTWSYARSASIYVAGELKRPRVCDRAGSPKRESTYQFPLRLFFAFPLVLSVLLPFSPMSFSDAKQWHTEANYRYHYSIAQMILRTKPRQDHGHARVQRDRVAHVLRMSARSTSHVGRNASRLIG